MEELKLELQQVEERMRNAEFKSINYYQAFFIREQIKTKIEKLEAEGV